MYGGMFSSYKNFIIIRSYGKALWKKFYLKKTYLIDKVTLLQKIIMDSFFFTVPNDANKVFPIEV